MLLAVLIVMNIVSGEPTSAAPLEYYPVGISEKGRRKLEKDSSHNMRRCCSLLAFVPFLAFETAAAKPAVINVYNWGPIYFRRSDGLLTLTPLSPRPPASRSITPLMRATNLFTSKLKTGGSSYDDHTLTI